MRRDWLYENEIEHFGKTDHKYILLKNHSFQKLLAELE